MKALVNIPRTYGIGIRSFTTSKIMLIFFFRLILKSTKLRKYSLRESHKLCNEYL